MPQLASLSWFFFSLFFILVFICFSVSVWWVGTGKIFSSELVIKENFNFWNW